eukprot:g5298.t1
MESKDVPKVDPLVDSLSAIPADDRFAALQAILGEDLSQQWEQGHNRPRIETYQSLLQAKVPELADGKLLAHLAEVELKARCRWPEPKDRPTVDDYATRFPDHPEIRDHLLSICYDNGRYVRYGLPLRGGMGRVWQTRDLNLQRQVALKEPLPERAGYPEVLQRLANEAYVTARLNHPAIVTVHEVDAADDDGPYYVMQWVEGEELKDAITRLHNKTGENPASLFRELLSALSTVCDALAYAHDQGVIHRDLKPANIIMGKYGELIVLDWGLAKSDDGVEISFDPNDTVTEPIDPVLQSAADTPAMNSVDPTVAKTEFIGTPLYMPPEQIDGDMSHRCDIFSLGAILYHILTGRPPRSFEDGTNRTTVARRVKSEPIAPPSQIKPDVPRSLEAVCLKAMQPNAIDRYQTASELGKEIERYLADEPVNAYRENRWERFQRMLRRRVRFAAASAVAVMLIAVSGIGFASFYGYTQQQAANTATRHAEQILKRKRTLDEFHYGSVINQSQRTWHRMQRRLTLQLLDSVRGDAENDVLDYRDWEWHFQKRLCHSEDLLLQGHTNAVHALTYSPDGAYLASAGSDNTIRVWNRRTGQLVYELKGHLHSAHPLEPHLVLMPAGEPGVDVERPAETADAVDRLLHVFALLRFQLQRRDAEPFEVERAILMGDQHDPLQPVRVDQKPQLFDHPFFLAVGAEMPGQTGRTAGNRKPIVPRQLQLVLQQIVELLAVPPVAAIHRRGLNPRRLKLARTLVDRRIGIHERFPGTSTVEVTAGALRFSPQTGLYSREADRSCAIVACRAESAGMKPQIKLRCFEYIPRHRDEYDPRFWQQAALHAMLDLADVPARRAQRFIVTLSMRLNNHFPLTTVSTHYQIEKRLLLWISTSSTKGEFSDDDFRVLKKYLAELRTVCGEYGARVLHWTKRVAESIPMADYGNTARFYSLGLVKLLAKRKRSYSDELELAMEFKTQTTRRIKSAFRKHPTGTLAELSSIAPKSDFYRTLAETLSDLIEPDCRRPDRWERRALLAHTDKRLFSEHLKAADHLDHDRTVELVNLSHATFQRRADRALGAAFRNARKSHHS